MIDKKKRIIINNESSDLIRILNHLPPPDTSKPYVHHHEHDARSVMLIIKQLPFYLLFSFLRAIDLYPLDLQVEIDRINILTYKHINNGVYRVSLSPSNLVPAGLPHL